MTSIMKMDPKYCLKIQNDASPVSTSKTYGENWFFLEVYMIRKDLLNNLLKNVKYFRKST